MATVKSEQIKTEWHDGALRVLVPTQPVITLTVDSCTAEIRHRAMNYGFEVKVTRAAALSRDPDTGKSATWAEKAAAILATVEALREGSWNVKAERVFDVGIVLQGMIRARIAGSVDDAERKVRAIAAKRDIVREAAAKIWAATPQVAQAIAAIRAERVKVDVDDLLAEAEGFEEDAGE